MSWTDRISVFVAAGAIVATLGVGMWSIDARFDDVDRRLDGFQADLRDLELLVEELIESGKLP